MISHKEIDFYGVKVREVGCQGNPEWIAADICKALKIESSLNEETLQDSVFTAPDLLAIAVERLGDDRFDDAELIFQFVRLHGSKNATVERLYHAVRIYGAWCSEIRDTNEAKQTSVVYLIRCEENNSMKIGFTTSIQHRIQSLQVSSPFKLKLIASIPGSQRLEKKLHKEFSHLRLSGEWFKWDASILTKFKYLQEGGR